MKRIVSVHIINFQSHTDTTIDFNKGLNAIVGQSDQGKTAIFRAIKWALYNRPLGSRFITKGKNYCSVEIFFDDGSIIRRYKKGNSNFYDVTLADGQSWTELSGFGTKVPAEVTMAHGMRQIILLDKKKKSLNLSEQLESPFLLSDSPAQKGSIIGRLLRTEITDRARKNVQKDIRNINKELDNLKFEIDKNKEEISSFDYVEEFEKNLNIAKKDMGELKKGLESYNVVENISIKLNRDYDRYKNLSETIKELKKYSDAHVDILLCIDEFRQYNTIANLKDSIDESRRRASECINILEKNKNIEEIYKDFNKLDKEFLQHKDANKKSLELQKSLSALIALEENVRTLEIQQIPVEDVLSLEKSKHSLDSIISTEEARLLMLKRKVNGLKVIEEIEVELTRAIDRYQDNISKFGKCPVCFSEMNDEALKNVAKNLF